MLAVETQRLAAPEDQRRAVLETARLAALHEYELLDQPADDELEAVVRVAAAVAGVPTATLNLLDEHRQCQLTTVGFVGADSARADSMCERMFRSGRTVYLPDARTSADYATNPWVTGRFGFVRFYTSVPLITPEGHALGTLCVFDEQPRELTADQLHRLEDLARVIVALFERRRQARRNAELGEADRRQRAALERAHDELAKRGQELERSNAELAQFAAVASHDLRSPLTVVDGYLGLLADHFADRLDARARDWIATVRTALERMLTLTDALLGYAQVGAGGCERRRVDAGRLLDEVLLDLEAEVTASGADVCAGVLPSVEADPVLLRQLLQNLLANAIAYRCPERPCRVAVRATRTDAGWSFAVADNGRGIPPEARAHVFDMFARLEPSAGVGHGIGLATCARIVERHGGRIWVEATPGGGSTIRFTLPVTDA